MNAIGAVREVDVAVVGAGLAGLVAARELIASGCAVAVLEARDRVGGRAHTVDLGAGRWANAGAEWVDSSHRHTLDLAAEVGVALARRRGFEALVTNGRLSRISLHDTLLARAIARRARGATRFDEPWTDPVLLRLDRYSLADAIAGLPGARNRRLARAEVSASIMAPPELVSLGWAAAVWALDDGDRRWRFVRGTQTLADALAAQLPDGALYLGAAASHVEWDDDTVHVTTDRVRLRARFVVLALPLTALARVRCDPPLALPTVGHGTGGKLIVPTHRRPSPAALVGRWRRARTRMEFVYDNAARLPGGGALTAYSSTPLDPSETVAAITTWFPEARVDGRPVAAWWHLDEWSGLTYSAPRPGDLAALAVLRQPIGPLILAGEHTEVLSGYLDSAIRSGKRAAATVIESDRRVRRPS